MVETLKEIEDSISAAPWFERMGRAQNSPQVMAVQSLQGFAHGGPWPEFTSLPPDMKVTWLPTSRDQGDPFWGDELTELARATHRIDDVKTATLRVFSLTLSLLRKLDGDPRLTVDGEVLVDSARGAALHAMRNLAREATLGKSGPWSKVAPVFWDGYWPLAVLEDGRTVVF